MPGNQDINLERVGGTKQSGANVIDSANSAVRVNVVAGSAPLAAMVRSLPLLNYSSLTISDNASALWALTENDDGTLKITATSGIAVPLILNDLTSLTSYQISVNASQQLQAAAVTFSLSYPGAVGFITSGGLKSALFVAGGLISTLQPTSAPDWVVSGTVSVSSGNVTAKIPDAGDDRTVRNVLEDINAGIRELTDFMYTLRDSFQYVQTPVSGTVQVGNFPASVTSVSVSNLPATQAITVADGMQDRVIRNLLEEILIAMLEQNKLLTPLNPTGVITTLEGIN